MRPVSLIIALQVLLLGCSTATSNVTPARGQISLSQIETLGVGVATPEQVTAAIGRPDRVFSPSANEEVWMYSEISEGVQAQKAGLLFDRATGRLLTATWVPSLTDSFRDQRTALAHFAAAKFEVKDVGWIARHSYSDEKIYEDSRKGVSLRINPVTKKVLAVSFGLPNSAQVVDQD